MGTLWEPPRDPTLGLGFYIFTVFFIVLGIFWIYCYFLKILGPWEPLGTPPGPHPGITNRTFFCFWYFWDLLLFFGDLGTLGTPWEPPRDPTLGLGFDIFSVFLIRRLMFWMFCQKNINGVDVFPENINPVDVFPENINWVDVFFWKTSTGLMF